MHIKEKIINTKSYILILLLPAIVFYWLIPFYGELTIGNDYGIFSIQQQMELAYSQKNGSFPLYSPGFAEGRSSAALTMGQMYHPLSYLASSSPGYWDGDALSWNTFFRLLSLGFTHLIVFLLLRKLGLRRVTSFLISFITVYNLRTLDLFRYGASLENHVGCLLLCSTLALYFLQPTKIAGPAAIIGSTYLLVCGGHPQMMYLGLLGAGITCVFIPFVLPSIDTKLETGWKKTFRFYGFAGLLVFVGILLSSAYIASFYFEFVADNALRVGRPYTWSLAYCDSIGGTLNNIFAPINADVHGAFGSTSLILLVCLVPLLFGLKVRVPVSVLFLIGVIGVIFLCCAGDATKLHFWFWKYVPLAQTFRTPGRLSMLLPFLILLVLAWLFRPIDKTLTFKKKELPFSPYAPLALLGAAIFFLYHRYLAELTPEPSHYVPFNIAKYDDWVEPTIYWIGLGTFGLCFLYAVTFKWRPELWKRALGVLLCIAVITQVTIQMRHGTWTKPVTSTPTLERMNQQKKEGLRFYGSPGFGMESPAVTRHMENGALDRSMARFYGNYIGVRTNKEAYDQMLRVRTSNTAVVEAFDRSSSGYNPSDILDQILLVHSSFNTVTFEVTNHIDGFLSFTWPNDGRWNADVDGTKSTIYKTNGIENGVFLKTGKHTVQFWYQSNATLIGAIIGTVTLTILGILFSFFSVAGWQRFAIGGVLTVSLVGMFAGWYHSLYNGNNLETTYAWTSAQFPNSKNLAYGKPTKMSSIRSVQMPYFYYSGLGVDGDIKGRPFSTHRRKGRPWWQVDLGSAKSIGEIVIYDRGRGRGNLPMNVTTSTDGRRFRTVMTIEDRGRTPVWRIQLNGESARFVRLHSMGRRPMSFSEIEIYPYTPNSKPAHPDPTGDLTLGSTE